jgi:LPPG:FO 2-phospho-L-lactate transferase
MSAGGRGPLVYLSGGVGGARLAHGLYHELEPERLICIINTGDDLVHWGLQVSPDLDTMLYTLADVADVERGWGLAGETFEALSWVKRYGGEAWFALGDRDLATHLMRSEWLRAGQTLTQVTARLCQALGVRATLLPMSDTPCATMIDTDMGTLGFQQWLVGERALPAVRRVWFRGDAQASAAVLAALSDASLVVIGPSNPYVSIDPILSLPGVRERLEQRPVIAVSPVVHGLAVKGPLAGMLETLAHTPPSAAAVAQHYGALLEGYVVECGDEAAITGLTVLATDTVMHTRADSRTLAARVLELARELGHWT